MWNGDFVHGIKHAKFLDTQLLPIQVIQKLETSEDAKWHESQVVESNIEVAQHLFQEERENFKPRSMYEGFLVHGRSGSEC